MAKIDELVGKHKGQTCFVVGSAPCVMDEFNEALAHHPQAIIIAVNDAASLVKADYIASIHIENMPRYKKNSVNPDAVCISGSKVNEYWPVDHWFTGANSGATSAYSAAQMARSMGFEMILMVGCPMTGGDGYYPGLGFKDTMMCYKRFGHSDPKHSVARAHKGALVDYASTEDCSMIRSMSGFTAEIFGLPEWRAKK